jgi:GT2 family glycosyltransferase
LDFESPDLRMKLSVIIVNYNVEYFLEQCLYSVRKASKGIEMDVFVVDNNSVDGSNRMVHEKFPEVILIENKENTGFSHANNQAIRISKSEYVLLLNPDTVVEDDTFQKVIQFMDQHPDAGALGVKMLDGKGKFLPESKRGLPTPMTAFYKIFGLSALFPRSKRFGRYHLGFLDKDKTAEIEIIAGAFMLMRKSVLDQTGLLDEAFFMYGEDIDLSYRITQAGFKNYYFPETRIIHYKGESTKKSSVNYVFVFYNAMIIFAQKHFSSQRAQTFSILIHIAIYFRAFIAIMARFFKQTALPFVDALLGYIGIFLIQRYWGSMTIYRGGGDYPFEFVALVVPGFLLLWLISVYLSGGYDKPIRFYRMLRGLAVGSILILVLYALLPESLRFSRALILLSTVWLTVAFTISRLFAHFAKFEGYVLGGNRTKRFLIIGDETEAQRVESIIRSTSIRPDFIGLVEGSEKAVTHPGFIGNILQVKDIITIYKINEVIFCSKNLSHQLIIDKMTEWHDAEIDYKIAPEDSLSIIGSNSINTRGDLYTIDIKAIDTAINRRNKRLFDLLTSLILIPVLPLILIFIMGRLRIISNIFMVLFGSRTWVGYSMMPKTSISKLPKIRPGILHPAGILQLQNADQSLIQQINLLYARDYTVWKDVEIFWKSIRNIGKKSELK